MIVESKIEPITDEPKVTDDLELIDEFELERLFETYTVGIWLLNEVDAERKFV